MLDQWIKLKDLRIKILRIYMDSLDIRFFKMAVGGDRIKQETPTDITARCPICGDS